MQQISSDISLDSSALIHIIGIGGIGMSAIAEILHRLGYKVQGSDLKENANTKRLVAMGIVVLMGQESQHVAGVDVVVRSTAVKSDNIEVMAANDLGIRVMSRAEMLGFITRLKKTLSITGTHGKTTTSSMVAILLIGAGLDPTVINGGIIEGIGSNARFGEGEWLVVEADESDGTFIELCSHSGIITNIEPEHLDHYGSFEKLYEAFQLFVKMLPAEGAAILCIDDPKVKQLTTNALQAKTVTYALKEQADFMAEHVTHGQLTSRFNVIEQGEIIIEGLEIPLPGDHMVQNALGAIALCRTIGMQAQVIEAAFATYRGVERRFTKVGEVGGVTIIDDYGHHPTEIKAVLVAAQGVVKGSNGRVIAVIQPHRFSRVKELMEEFTTCAVMADMIYITDIFPAGELPIAGVDKECLQQHIAAKTSVPVHTVASVESLAKQLAPLVKAGDYVICLGAGSITEWAKNLPSLLKVQLVALGFAA